MEYFPVFYRSILSKFCKMAEYKTLDVSTVTYNRCYVQIVDSFYLLQCGYFIALIVCILFFQDSVVVNVYLFVCTCIVQVSSILFCTILAFKMFVAPA